MTRRKKVYDNEAVDRAWAIYNESVASAKQGYDHNIALSRQRLTEMLAAAEIKEPKVKKP